MCCEAIPESNKNKFIVKLGRASQKINRWQKIKQDIIKMIYDIIHFIMNEEEPRTMQGLIGMSGLFQGFVVKDWVNNNKTTKYIPFNKVLIRKCTKCYYKCWEE